MKIIDSLRDAVRTATLIGLVGAILFALAGCGSSESSTPPPAPAGGQHKPDLTQDEK